jgi:hypothetical protein
MLRRFIEVFDEQAFKCRVSSNAGLSRNFDGTPQDSTAIEQVESEGCR